MCHFNGIKTNYNHSYDEFSGRTDVSAAKSVSVNILVELSIRIRIALARCCIFRTILGVIAFLHFLSDY